MITIEKRKIDVDVENFKAEIILLCELLKKHNPSLIGLGIIHLNNHFNLKLKITDFYQLSEKLGFKVSRGKFWYFENIKPEQ